MNINELRRMREVCIERLQPLAEKLLNSELLGEYDAFAMRALCGVHETLCREIDANCALPMDEGERTEIKRIADSLELITSPDDFDEGFLTATIDELRCIAARGGVA